MGYFLFAHGNVNQAIALIQKIIVTAIDIPADGFILVQLDAVSSKDRTL